MDNLCNNCIHKDVCSRWTATWGMKSCENFLERAKTLIKANSITADDLLYSILVQMDVYAAKKGEYPKCILANRDAYKIIEGCCDHVLGVQTRSKAYLFGIEFRMVLEDGLDIYLSDGPIPIRRKDDG